MSNYLEAANIAIERCRQLARFSESPHNITRTFLSAPMHDAHKQLSEWTRRMGVETSIDAAGNWRASYPGKEAASPRLLIGSHLDTVRDAGAFDGPLGVVLGIALIECLGSEKLPFAIEVIGFSEEEGVRFGLPFIGSRALVGSLDATLLNRADEQGMTVGSAIQSFGLDPANLADAKMGDDTLGYLEFHIEQGPVLEDRALPLAAVDAIAAQTRLELLFRGSANHAGTTPMRLRRDAMAGAAEWILEVEDQGRSEEELVATVGVVETKPGAANVVPGEVRCTLDVRHKDDPIRTAAVNQLLAKAGEIARRRRLSVSHRVLLEQASVCLNPFFLGLVEQAIGNAGCTPNQVTSGAGHDAMILAQRVPSAMIFLRSPGGISHSPEETVLVEDVAHAIEAGVELLHLLANTPNLQRRMKSA